MKIIVNKSLDVLNEEIDISYKMSKLRLGPEIYDTFYIKIMANDYPHKLHPSSKIQSNYTIFVQYIIMEFLNVIKFTSYTARDRQSIVRQMISLLQESIKNKIYCKDIKIDNFLIDEDVNVKMIDFGTWCKNIQPTVMESIIKASSVKDKVNKFIFTNLVQLFMSIYHNHVYYNILHVFNYSEYSKDFIPFFNIDIKETSFLEFVNNLLPEDINYNYEQDNSILLRTYLFYYTSIKLHPVEDNMTINRTYMPLVINKVQEIVTKINDTIKGIKSPIKQVDPRTAPESINIPKPMVQNNLNIHVNISRNNTPTSVHATPISNNVSTISDTRNAFDISKRLKLSYGRNSRKRSKKISRKKLKKYKSRKKFNY